MTIPTFTDDHTCADCKTPRMVVGRVGDEYVCWSCCLKRLAAAEAASANPIAEVGFSCGRCYLAVAGIAVAMEGDACRHMLPPEIREPIPEWEMEKATIGGESIKGMDPEIVQFFRGEAWRKESLEWAAQTINEAAKGGRDE